MNHRMTQIARCFCIALCTRLTVAVLFWIGLMICTMFACFHYGFPFPLFVGFPPVLLFPYHGLCMLVSSFGPEPILVGVLAEAIAIALCTYILVMSSRRGTLGATVLFLSIVHALVTSALFWVP